MKVKQQTQQGGAFFSVLATSNNENKSSKESTQWKHGKKC